MKSNNLPPIDFDPKIFVTDPVKNVLNSFDNDIVPQKEILIRLFENKNSNAAYLLETYFNKKLLKILKSKKIPDKIISIKELIWKEVLYYTETDYENKFFYNPLIYGINSSKIFLDFAKAEKELTAALRKTYFALGEYIDIRDIYADIACYGFSGKYCRNCETRNDLKYYNKTIFNSSEEFSGQFLLCHQCEKLYHFKKLNAGEDFGSALSKNIQVINNLSSKTSANIDFFIPLSLGLLGVSDNELEQFLYDRDLHPEIKENIEGFLHTVGFTYPKDIITAQEQILDVLKEPENYEQILNRGKINNFKKNIQDKADEPERDDFSDFIKIQPLDFCMPETNLKLNFMFLCLLIIIITCLGFIFDFLPAFMIPLFLSSKMLYFFEGITVIILFTFILSDKTMPYYILNRSSLIVKRFFTVKYYAWDSVDKIEIFLKNDALPGSLKIYLPTKVFSITHYKNQYSRIAEFTEYLEKVVDKSKIKKISDTKIRIPLSHKIPDSVIYISLLIYFILVFFNYNLKEYYIEKGYRTNDLKKRIEYANSGLAINNPNDKNSDNYLLDIRGQAYFQLHENDSALLDFNKLIEKKTDNYYLYSYRARIYYKKKLYDKAIADACIAISADSKDYSAYYTRAESYFKNKFFDTAIIDYTYLINNSQNPFYTYASRATCYGFKKEYAKALADFNDCVKLEPENKYSYYFRSVPSLDLKKYSSAISDLKKAISIDSNFVKALNSLAWLYATCPDTRFRNGAAAEKYALKAYSLENKDYIIDTLAAAYAENGNFKMAIDKQNEAISACSNTENIKEYREHLEMYKQGRK